ncbi:unnamed protein product [Boreogadus saida]
MYVVCSGKGIPPLGVRMKLDERVLRTDQGLLIRSLAPADAGVYHCHAVEHGFVQPLLRLTLQVIPTQRLGDILPAAGAAAALGGGGAGAGGPAGGSKHRVWYRDFLSLLDHPDLSSVEEFCDRVWKKERKQKRFKAPAGDAQGPAVVAVGTAAAAAAPRPKAPGPNGQKRQGTPAQSGPRLGARGQAAEGAAAPVQSAQTGVPSPTGAATSGQGPKNSQRGQNTQTQNKGSQAAGGPRAGPQHSAKWRRMQENKKGRNRRTHELQRPPRSV